MSGDEYDYELNGDECISQCNDVILSGEELCWFEVDNRYPKFSHWEYHPDLDFINRGIRHYDVDVYDVTLTEYRRIWMLFKSDGCDDKEFIRNFHAADYEMCAEWMKYVRDEQKNLKAGDITHISKCCKRFNLNPKEIFEYMYVGIDDLINYLKEESEWVYYGYVKHNSKYDCVDLDEINGTYYELYVGEVTKIYFMLKIPGWCKGHKLSG